MTVVFDETKGEWPEATPANRKAIGCFEMSPERTDICWCGYKLPESASETGTCPECSAP